MWCVILFLFTVVLQTTCIPFWKSKGTVLFTCPPDDICYASPRNCLDDCTAAFSMRSNRNGTTTFNVTMMSPLSYTAVLIKEKEDEKFETAIICSFHLKRGIVAKVNFPWPVTPMRFVDTRSPEGRTDSTHTSCSTTVFMPPPPRGTKFKLISGKWKNVLVIDEHLAIDVVPAVENARILSTNKQLIIPSPKIPVFRALEAEHFDDMTSESFAQRRQFERKTKQKARNKEGSLEVEDNEESIEGQSQFNPHGPWKYDTENDETNDYTNDGYESRDNRRNKKEKTSSNKRKKNNNNDNNYDSDENDYDEDSAYSSSTFTSVLVMLFSFAYIF